jgi:hypothetical protein
MVHGGVAVAAPWALPDDFVFGCADLFRCLDAEGLDSLSMAQKRLRGFHSDRIEDADRV